jgi:hypothetical protein
MRVIIIIVYTILRVKFIIAFVFMKEEANNYCIYLYNKKEIANGGLKVPPKAISLIVLIFFDKAV